MPDIVSLGMAFSLGFLGSVHCLGMCGGIACMMSARRAAVGSGSASIVMMPTQGSVGDRVKPLLAYNTGRITSYAIIGLLVGLGSELLVDQWQMLGPVLRTTAGVLLLLMGLYVAGLSRLIALLESRMAAVIGPDQLFKRLSTSKLPVFVYGLGWGWLPCGLVYSSLAWATATSQSAQGGALLMAMFGLGTLPAMVATGLFAEGLRHVLKLQAIRLAAGCCIILYGVWTLLGAVGHREHSGHNGGVQGGHSDSMYLHEHHQLNHH